MARGVAGRDGAQFARLVALASPVRGKRFTRIVLLAAAATATLGGCSLVRDTAPPASPVEEAAPAAVAAETAPSPDPEGQRLLALAEQQLGAPYRYGGASPGGFDCSGLVLYVHGVAGITVPRTAAGQQLAARPVDRGALQPGDLVFFASDGTQIDHVGIYAGDGRFVHAPRTGRPVAYDRLDDPWYAPRWRSAGRFRSAVALLPAGARAP